MQCNQKMMRRKKNINWGYGFVQTKANSQNLESKKCMADRAENLQLDLWRRGRGRSFMSV